MIKDYIKEFDTDSEYQSYIAGDPVLPNVSYIVETNEVAFNPIIPPRMDIITYEASAKLSDKWSDETATFGTTIKSHTFENGVGTIEFNADVTSIGNKAFRGCSDLTSISIPDSVTSIGGTAFGSCSKLTRLNSDVDGLFSIPDSVTSIGSNVFNGCRSLTSITIPSSVTSIGAGAFNKCSSLTSITIPEGVTSIGNQTFSECKSLTNIVIPNNVTSIGSNVFTNCYGLTSITIGSSVTSIDNQAFVGCSSLTSITSLATTAPTIQSRTFIGIKTNGTLTVPTGSTGYDVWMGTGDYYLGKYGWTKVEQ